MPHSAEKEISASTASSSADTSKRQLWWEEEAALKEREREREREQQVSSASSSDFSSLSDGERKRERDLPRRKEKKGKKKRRKKEKRKSRGDKDLSTHDTHGARHAFREPPPVGLRLTPAAAWWTPSLQTAYFFDTKGDKDNLFYGSLDRSLLAILPKRKLVAFVQPGYDTGMSVLRYFKGRAALRERNRRFKRLRIDQIRKAGSADEPASAKYLPMDKRRPLAASVGESIEDRLWRKTKEFNIRYPLLICGHAPRS